MRQKTIKAIQEHAAAEYPFYLHSLDEPLLFSSRRFKQTADLGTSDQVAATAERKN
ncbi:TPA: hypothetical protein ACIFNG_005025 [Klebsiella pneumoniae]